MNNTEIYQKITDQLIEILQTHKNLDYTCNWTPSEVVAKNAISERPYKGFNQIYLSFVASQKYQLNRWLTFRQGNELNAKVKKGEHAYLVTFWKMKYYDKNTRRDCTHHAEELLKLGRPLPENYIEIPFLRYHYVFNADQFEGLPGKLTKDNFTVQPDEFQKDERAEQIIQSSGAIIEYKKGNSCYYIPGRDKIVMCTPEQFKGKEAYYSVLFHELGHWTGHPSRLNRDLHNAFGTPDYAFEELVAEFCSAYMSAENGFTSKITNNAAYIENWLQLLQNDCKIAYRAASKAQTAAMYISSLVEERIKLHDL